MVNFPTWIPDRLSQYSSFGFLSFDASICSAIVFPPLGNSDHVVVSVSIDFDSNSKRDALFCRIAFDLACADGDGLCEDLRDVPWEKIIKLGASAAASECVFSLWFSAAYSTAIAHRNHFFLLAPTE